MEKKIIKKYDQGNGQWILNTSRGCVKDGSPFHLSGTAYFPGQGHWGLRYLKTF